MRVLSNARVDRRRQILTLIDVLCPDTEISEHAPMPPPPPDKARIQHWYVVFCGRFMGCLKSLHLKSKYVDGYSMNQSQSYSSFVAMCDAWRAAYLSGSVSGPLSPKSLVPFIVSDAEAQRRVDA
ncbi:hypothetical protein PsYK624_163120 [Phanerochaete sordida]|uniref:Uncharacterized protein n=1 Tax=Phanerochaete sordida TaxID=48140 RepID=A0A9P3GT39_9APHY|nr:hypothetical protein PsYK624_163120 [Phanerochaete sordida]